MSEQRTFSFPEGLVSALLNYLSSRPHGEVNQLVTAFSQSIQSQLTPEEIAAITGKPAPQAAASAAPQLVKA